jgi:hypothetical protein
MKAEKMFEKLGYKIYTLPLYEEYFLTYRKEVMIDGWLHIIDIEFNTKKKTLKVSEQGYDYTLNVKELKAIYAQMKELGWLNE